MVLESLMTPQSAEKKPWMMFLMGVLYSSVAIIISLLIFGEVNIVGSIFNLSLNIFADIQASWVMVFLTVLASIPLMYKTLIYEEKKDIEARGELTLLREHSKAITFFLFLFLGFTISFVVWGLALPSDVTTNLFHFQAQTIEGVNGTFYGFSIFSDSFNRIFSNNISILLLSFIFSFIFSSGAIFILAWNASIIGAAITSKVIMVTTGLGGVGLFAYLQEVIYQSSKILFHGIFEMGAFFIAALAGGILSIAMLKEKKLKPVIKDVYVLLIISFFVLLFAALLETYVNPLIFN